MMRMQRGRIMMLAAVSAAIISARVLAAVSADEKAIRGQYAVYVQAMKAKNLSRISPVETSDFTHTMMNGRVMNKAASDAALQRTFRAMASVKALRVTISSIVIQPKSAVVMAESYLAATFVDAQKKPHQLVDTLVSRDTWVKTPHGWRIRRTQDLSERQTIDGRAVNNS